MSLTVANARPARQRTATARIRPAGDALNIAFINNMPDPAFRSTERQFTTTIQAAANGIAVRCHLFTIGDAVRGHDVAAHIATRYGRLPDLLRRSFDGVVVTGNEPKAARFPDEPYWPEFTRLIDWADRNTRSSIWSCLAAHAAVFHLDGIARVPLPRKLSGVFDCAVERQDALVDALPVRCPVPHSRYNDLPVSQLVASGYRILRQSAEVGVDLFTCERRSRFVFLQGHPEYDADTLLREYRRDVGRYLRGEQANYPDEPEHYFSAEAQAVLRAFRRRALAHRDPELFGVFPNLATPFAIGHRWTPANLRLYRNWLSDLLARQPSRARR